MEIIPAIDIKDGKCVRLLQGDYHLQKIYAENPEEIAQKFEAVGAPRLHLIDLNGASDGHPVNSATIKKILASISIPVQLGGGVRTLETMAELLNLGVDRVIVGTMAFQQPEVLAKAVRQFGAAKVVVGIDARQSKVAISGWKEQTELNEVDLALAIKKIGVERINYTDISRDGMLTGPNFPAIRNMAMKTGLQITASGGVSSIRDIENLKLLEFLGVDSVIVGKAIYEHKIDLDKLFQ